MRTVLVVTSIVLALATGSVAQAAVLPPLVVKPIGPGEVAKPFQFAKLVTRIPSGRNWGSVSFYPICYPKSALAWDGDANELDRDIDAEFRSQASKAGFEVAGDNNNLFETDSGGNAEYAIGGLITDIKMDVCMPWAMISATDERTKGSAQMTVEWQIYSRLKREVVAKITTTGAVDLKSPVTGGHMEVWRGAFAENVKGLINAPEFRKVAVSSAENTPATGKSVAKGDRPLITYAKPTAKPAALTDVVGSVVTVMAEGHGSGFLISTDGYVLTNQHVTSGSKYVKIRWSDGLESVGEVMREEKGRDVALIKTDSRGRLPLAMRRGAPALGSEVYAIGAPFDEKLQGTVTRGIVSTSNRIFEGYNFIQSDVAVNPGNSGGPLVNKEGEVLGLTVLGLGRDEAMQGLNLFIPAGDALDFLGLQ